MTPVSGYAPGRVELLGNHTDYNQGVVLAAAIDRGLTVTGVPRGDDVIQLSSPLIAAEITTSVSDLRSRTDNPWANYALGVVAQFRGAGYPIGGFTAEVSGDVPAGAGLSSSAAFEVATAGFLMALHDLRIDPLEVAKLCRRAENEFVGVQSGLLDQVTSVFGRANHVVFLDCRSEEIRTIPFPTGLALVIAQSRGKHDLLQSLYNQRREECTAAGRALGVSSLRDVSPAQLECAAPNLEPLLHRRAAHIVGENDRVLRAVEILKSGDDPRSFGHLMNASHESSRTNFENSTADLDRLVEIARSLPGVFGSRLTGGGFGGATVTLVESARADDVVERLRPHAAAVFVCQAADGAAVSWSH
ncbi:MAG: galactokinase [Chthoniobacterales bacterium]